MQLFRADYAVSVPRGEVGEVGHEHRVAIAILDPKHGFIALRPGYIPYGVLRTVVGPDQPQ